MHYNIFDLCSVAQVSRSGYYAWLSHADDPEKDYGDFVVIKEIFEKGKKKLGWRTIQMRLKDRGAVMNHKKIQRIMSKYRLFTKIRKVNPYKMIMKKTQEHRTFPNILNRAFTQALPRKVFCTDITYLPFNRRMAYLSVIKDVASREAIAWKLSSHLTMPLATDTVARMKASLPSCKDILIHSDQGVHYTHPDYQAMLKELGMVQSMSRKGNCIDNAPIESFFGHLKDDVDYKHCKTFEQLNLLIEEYMKYYNNERHQWDLKKMTPAGYRDHLFTTAG